MSQIYKAVSASVYRLPVLKKIWVVLARGEASSPGWSNPRLVHKGSLSDYVVLDFEADPPNGEIVTPVIVPIAATGMVLAPGGAKGVVIRSQTNEITVQPHFHSVDKDGTEDFDFLPYEMDQGDVPEDDADEDPGPSLTAPGAGALRSAVRTLASATTEVCQDKTLLRVPLFPEFKVKKFHLYKRWRYNVTELHYCYPKDATDAIKEAIRSCLPVAIAAGVAGFAGGGPAGAVAAFEAAFEGCAAAEAAKALKVSVRNRQEKGRWSRV